MNIVINEKFKSLIPALSEDEFNQLEQNIISDGCRDPLVLWNHVLIDGHNRFDICSRNKIKFETVNKQFDDESHAEEWIITNQFGRRNINDYTRGVLALRLKSVIAARAKNNQIASGGAVPQKSAKPVDTRAELAKVAGVSHDTIHKVEMIEKNGSDGIKQALRSGEISINLASQVVKLPDEEREIVASSPIGEMKQVAKEIVKAHVANNSGNNEWYTPVEYIDLAREVMGSIDTDPASCKIANKTVNAKVFFTEKDDGLLQVWKGNVWMNPPYAQPLIAQFCDAIVDRYKAGEIDQACVLVNNGTETAWGQKLLCSASAVCFPKSRIKFIDPNGNPSGTPLQGQMIVYLGVNVDKFKKLFGSKGAILERD